MFCPNCGKKCETGMHFCWNCGTKQPVTQPAAPTVPATPPIPCSTPSAGGKPESSAAHETPSKPETSANTPSAPLSQAADVRLPAGSKSGACEAEGVIFTNLRTLARKLGTDTGTLRGLLSVYAGAVLGSGMRYHLIDVSDYHFLNPQAVQNPRVSLSPSDSWIEHNYVLADYFRFGRSTQEDVTNYLFIIGGSDVIPMPVVPHYVTDVDLGESDIDTDIPYAYILGEKTYRKFGTAELFQYEQYFHVGRLPLAADASLDDLTGYLRRAAASVNDVNVKRSFGLTDLTWLSASAWVSDPHRRHKLYRGDDRLDESIFTRNLYISPCVDSSVMDQIFDRTADIFYFNLHGSDAPTMPGFYASYQGEQYESIMPRHLAAASKPNMVVTEACYGAKFQDYNRDETMLLAAMGNKTLAYLGSSRIAWGASECDSQSRLDNADRITNVYMAKLLEGHTVGEALFLARQSFFEKNNGHFTPRQALTIVEFNLFGDPFLFAGERQGEVKLQPREVKALTKSPVNAVVEHKCVYRAKPASVLDEVRNAVDHNLMMIRSTVDKQLYERLGVEPRKLSTVTRMKYGNGEEFYDFNYVETNGTIQSRHSATTDLKGNVITIVSTK